VSPNHLGSTNVVLGEDGYINQLLDYYPYGETRIENRYDTHNQTNRYTGHEHDEETELSYMGARYYPGRAGRFISQDPVSLALGDWQTVQDKTGDKLGFYIENPQTHNSYSYAANNPIKYVDKNGEFLQYVAALFLPSVAYAPDAGQENYTNTQLETSIVVAGFASPSGKFSNAG
jgi:RHS repeat-associated protein